MEEFFPEYPQRDDLSFWFEGPVWLRYLSARFNLVNHGSLLVTVLCLLQLFVTISVVAQCLLVTAAPLKEGVQVPASTCG